MPNVILIKIFLLTDNLTENDAPIFFKSETL